MNIEVSDSYKIVWLVRRLFRAMGRTADEYLGELGITAAERAVIEFLYPDIRMSVPEIATKYDVSRQHIQVIVNGLLGKSLVHSAPNPAHKRSNLFLLSDKAIDQYEQITKRDKEAIDQAFKEIPEADLKQTRKTLDRLLENINGDKS